jgi:DNA-binding XRE family transcriptional regulator
MTIEERRKILGAKLRNARKRADAQRKLSKTQRRTPDPVAKKHLPMTQAFAAHQVGISQSFLSKLEKGEQQPDFLLLERLAAYYGFKVSAFATYTHEEWRAGQHLNDR